MTTQIEAAREGRVTPEIAAAARSEGVDPEALARDVAAGLAVVPWNPRRGRESALAVGIGRGLTVKTNANLGTSPDSCDVGTELDKLRAAEEAGADSVMDLSTGADPAGAEGLRAIRRELIAATRLVFGTVPVYDAAVEATAGGGSILDMTPESMLAAVRRHAEDGADFATIHAGVTRRALLLPTGSVQTGSHVPPDEDAPEDGPPASVSRAPSRLDEAGPGGPSLLPSRLTGIVSRGGSFLARWMLAHDEENPFYERYDELLEIALEFDLTLSLGDGLRPGALADAGDEAQTAELVEIASLVKRAREAGVQAMVEGPGHVPLHMVRSQIETAKRLTGGAPLYVLGPIVTDVAAGYDHIAAAIGGAVAGWAGADFLCVVTPAEHLSLPTPGDVREGVIAARIAAHAAEVARGRSGAREWDDEVSRLRARAIPAGDWDAVINTLLDPERARCIRAEAPPADPGTCSMCGPYCVFKATEK